MDIRFDHALERAPEPTAAGQHRVIFSELPRSEYVVDSSALSLNFVLEGEERYEVGQRWFRVLPGQFVVIEAGLRIRATLPRRATTRALCLCLPGSFAGFGGATLDAMVLSGRTTPLGRGLGAWAAGLAANPRSGAAMSPSHAARTMEELPRFAAALTQGLQALPARACTARALLQRLDRACDYLHAHLEAPVPLDRLASVAAMSPHHLVRSFKAAYGAAPGRYHQSIRMNQAAAELRSGTLTAAEAGIRYGFSDQSSFSRAFRRHFRTSPSRFAAGAPAE